MPEDIHGRRGGAGPSEGQVIILKDQYISVPTGSDYVQKSPYRMTVKHRKFMLLKNDTCIGEIFFPDVPAYYLKLSESGIALSKIALIHGQDCFASTVYQDCNYFDAGMECKFCGIHLSLNNGQTIKEKDPELLADTALKAKTMDKVAHVTLTSGQRSSSHDTAAHLAACAYAIKQKTALPVHAQICPAEDENIYLLLKNAGVDTLGIHIETCNINLLQKIAPMKAKLGIDHYVKAWDLAVKHFGHNQVSSFLIAGIGNSLSDIISSSKLMASRGVFPYVLPFRPIPGTPLGHLLPPAPSVMKEIYLKTARITKDFNLSSAKAKAGCVRCGACSAITEFV